MSSPTTEYIAIGDIHGCSRTLKQMLEKLDEEYGKAPTYVFLGDYVDRGPDSKGVIELLIEFTADHDCVFIRGNHDQVMLESLSTGFEEDWRMMGGETTIESYNDDVPEDHKEFLEDTQLFFDTPEFMFVHAGAPLTSTLEEGKDLPGASNYYLWGRGHLNRDALPWEKPLVFGHTPVKEPIVSDQMIGVDTGCVYKKQGYGVMTAIALPEKKLIQLDCIDL